VAKFMALDGKMSQHTTDENHWPENVRCFVIGKVAHHGKPNSSTHGSSHRARRAQGNLQGFIGALAPNGT